MLQHVSAFLIRHHMVDVGYTKGDAKEEGRLFAVLWTVTLLFQKWNNKVKTNT